MSNASSISDFETMSGGRSLSPAFSRSLLRGYHGEGLSGVPGMLLIGTAFTVAAGGAAWARSAMILCC